MEQKIEINISDSEFGLQRKITVLGYEHSIGASTIKLFCQCKHYKNGEFYETMALQSFQRDLVAAQRNGRMVDIDGLPLIATEEPGVDEDGNPFIDIIYTRPDQLPLKGIPVNQYEFFANMIFNSSISIPGLITSVVLMEDQINKTFDK